MNLKYTSGIKQYLSYILCPVCVKYKNKVIVAHMEDRDDKENYNEKGYAYKENRFDIISINQMYYELFLAYKIPNGIKDEADLKFNVLIELFENENSERKNALISLKYIPEENELRLITMF